MQKMMNTKTVGAVHTPYLYKINVHAKQNYLVNKEVIKIVNTDKIKAYEKK